MKQFFTLFLLCVSVGLFAQVGYTANDQITPYTGGFRPGVNPAYYNGWTDQQIADLAAGNSLFGVPGIGAKALRTAISDDFITQFGLDYLLPTYSYYQSLGLVDNTCIVGFPHSSHKEQVEYCSGIQSEMFDGLYEDIWDGGANGTPYNDDNLFAAYLYEVVVRYKDYITFWEIWNEPGLDYTGNCGWREPGDLVCNWWDNNPDPCDYKLRAPIYSYVRTLRIAYDIIKTLDPDAYVVVAGVGFESFLDAALRNTDNPVDGSVTAQYPHGAGAYFDVMGFHSYPHFDGTTIYYDNTIPGLAFERNSDRAAFGIPFKQNIRQAVLDNYGYDGVTFPKKEWIITEANVARDVYQNAGGNFNYLGGEEVQKNYIIKAVANSIRYNINQFHVFRLAEREYSGTANYEFDVMGLYQRLDETAPYNQILNIEGMAYKTASDCLFGTTWDEGKTNQMNLPNGVGGGAFKQANGEYVYCIWAITTLDESEVANANYTFPASFGYLNIYKKDWDFSQTFASSQINANNIALTGTPVFLTENEFVPPASITLTCPADLTVFASQNANGATVNYNQPNVSTTCSSGLMMTLTGGFASGATFPLGLTQVEYEATDDCGNVVICNFNVTVQAPVGGCPSVIAGFTLLGEHNNHKYFISNGIARPADAQIAAQTVGGHLAVINDQAENTFIQQNVTDLVYIGLNDVATEGQMEWINGDALTYTNYDLCAFCTGNSADDDYVVMHPWNGGWSYSNQFNQRLYVIELPCDGGGNNTTLNINCPANLELTTSGPGATVVVSWDTPTTSGDCMVGGVSVNQITGPPNGTSVSAGVYNILYTSFDGCGNMATCNFEVTVLEGLGSSCPGDIAGFTALGEFGGHKYYISDAISKPVAAAANAVANNGYLVAINSQAENDFIQQNVSDMVYIGLNDVGAEGSLVWGNGDPLNYNNVNPCGFCNENSDGLDYVIMQPWNGGWSFSSLWNSRLYVMEVDCDGGTSTGNITLSCPADMQVTANGAGMATVNFSNATGSTTCPSGGLSISQTSGINSGGQYAVGNYSVTFSATDNCNNTSTCTFNVEIVGGSTGCPDNLPGFELLGEFGGSAYFMSNDIARAEDAEVAAQNVGGHLVTINSQAENDFLQPHVQGVMYIGMHDANVEGTLEWFDGTAVGYTNFNVCGFCNENSGEQDYVIIQGWDGGWSWSNFWNQRQYIIEVPCGVNITTPPNSNLVTLNNSSFTNLENKKATLESVVPNPAENYIFVKINSQMEEMIDVQIFDARGALVKSVPVELYEGLIFKELDITDLPSGFYFVKIPQGQKNNSLIKFVKQRF